MHYWPITPWSLSRRKVVISFTHGDADSRRRSTGRSTQALPRDIQSGRLKRGIGCRARPSSAGRSGRRELRSGEPSATCRSHGLVERRAGSGTFVTAGAGPRRLSFGLLIPDLGETDIFEPVCQGMMASPLARNHALVWGSPRARRSKEDRAWQLCRQYIDRRVSGVFFAPLEFTAADDRINQRIVEALDAARIPVVLLDRTVTPYPHRGHHDLVGIDNRRAGFIITEHAPSARRPPHRVRRRAAMPPRLSMRARPATARRCTPPTSRSSAALIRAARSVRRRCRPRR